jgi:hypothetical protein
MYIKRRHMCILYMYTSYTYRIFVNADCPLVHILYIRINCTVCMYILSFQHLCNDQNYSVHVGHSPLSDCLSRERPRTYRDPGHYPPPPPRWVIVWLPRNKAVYRALRYKNRAMPPSIVKYIHVG